MTSNDRKNADALALALAAGYGPADSATNFAESLPKTLPGAVCLQWVRCGRPRCRCTKGKLHGPYAYRFFRVGGRLRKQYLPKALVKDVVQACEARREFQRQLKVSWEEWRTLLSQIREAEPT